MSAARELLAAADVVVPHTDADGLAAGAIALRARREGADAALLLGRGETPWTHPLPPGIPALLDWGMRELDRPALIVDHHAPEAEPRPDQVYVSSADVCTAVLMARLVPEAPRWVTAVGAVGDMGDAAWALDEVAGAPKTAVRKLVPLVNAPRRLPGSGAVRTALALLTEAPDARDALADPRIAELEEAKAAWRSDFERVRRTAPRVGERAAVVRFTSPFQVHPLVASTWERRLAPRPVIAANDDYLPGMVNFSVRGGDGDLRLLLKEALPEGAGEFAHGHPRATGGSLPPELFDLLLERLGVPPA